MYKLYLKEHNKTGLKYLGYTKKEDAHKYTGSGVHWKRHIAKHGYDVTTTVLFETECKNELKEKGIQLSQKYGVIDNPEFANLKTEEGVSGEYGQIARKKMSESAKKRGAPVGAFTSEKVAELNRKTWQDPEIRKKRSEGISKALKGKKRAPRSEEFKRLMSEKLKGRSYGKGLKHNLKAVTCPHCNKEGKGPNMTRYHFDNCKENPFGDPQ